MSRKQRTSQYDPNAETKYALKVRKRRAYARKWGFPITATWPEMGIKDSRTIRGE
jgi:hypothetical protein